MQHYDVIIIGAGPAGLNCARILEGHKLKVLILEKNPRLGEKVCAQGLLNHGIEYLNNIGKMPQGIIELRFSTAKIHGRMFDSIVDLKRDFIYTIDRPRLANWQAGLLKKCKIKKSSNVEKITDKYVVVGKERYSYKYLVGADGSKGIVRNFLGISVQDFGIAMQYILPRGSFNDVEFFLDSRYFKSGYAWIFPHKNYVSIGCGADRKIINSGELKNNFDLFLKKQKINLDKARFEAHVMNHDFAGCDFGNIFLAGDAAGLLSGITGEGIYQALVSGEEVARKILDKNYTMPALQKIIETKKRHKEMLDFFNKFPARQVLYDLAILMSRNKRLVEKYSYLNKM